MPQLFWFRPLFMFELLFAEGMFAINLNFRKGFAWRFPLGLALCFGLSFAFPYTVGGSIYYSLIFIGMFCLTLAMGALCFDAPMKNILFCAIAGYTVQHIASECYEIFNSAMSTYVDRVFNFYETTSGNGLNEENFFFVFVYFAIFAIIYGLAGYFIAPRVEKFKVLQTSSGTILALSGFILLIDVVIGAVVMSVLPQSAFVSMHDNIAFCIQLLLHVYNILCCVLAVILLIEIPRRSSIESELRTTTQLHAREREQYTAVKENMDIINIKCHDLKHQMRTLLSGKQVDSEEIKKIEDAINIYQSAYKTENEALNVVLMEKDMLCKSKGIDLSCILDGAGLEFMSDSDVYALFGNIMDNAIEAVSRLPIGNRAIGLQIKTHGSFVTVIVYNGYEGNLEFKGGLPQTTKGDTSNHGYGLKSIRYIVNKYDGKMLINGDGGVFRLTLLFQNKDNSLSKAMRSFRSQAK